MQIVDWVAIGVVLLALAIGSLLGFGKLLKIFTGGVVGIVISIVVTYFLFGIVSSWGFVQDLMAKLLTAMENANNGFVDFLIKIGTEKIILAIVMVLIIQAIRVILVNIIKGISEVDNKVIRVFNRILGAIFMLAVAIMIWLIVFQIMHLIGGATTEDIRAQISGSVFRLDWVFDNNPLIWIVKRVVP